MNDKTGCEVFLCKVEARILISLDGVKLRLCGTVASNWLIVRLRMIDE